MRTTRLEDLEDEVFITICEVCFDDESWSCQFDSVQTTCWDLIEDRQNLLYIVIKLAKMSGKFKFDGKIITMIS